MHDLFIMHARVRAFLPPPTAEREKHHHILPPVPNPHDEVPSRPPRRRPLRSLGLRSLQPLPLRRRDVSSHGAPFGAWLVSRRRTKFGTGATDGRSESSAAERGAADGDG